MLMFSALKKILWAGPAFINYKYPSIFPIAAEHTKKTFYSAKLHSNTR